MMCIQALAGSTHPGSELHCFYALRLLRTTEASEAPDELPPGTPTAADPTGLGPAPKDSMAAARRVDFLIIDCSALYATYVRRDQQLTRDLGSNLPSHDRLHASVCSGRRR